MLFFWDWVSASSLALIAYPIIQYITTNDPVYIVFSVGLWFTAVLTMIAKIYTFKYIDAAWVRRPQGAHNCDIMCRNGDRSNAAGFPSGHMSTAAFFVVFLTLLVRHQKLESQYIVIACGAFYIVLTGFARYYKKCHNMTQIIAGTIFGALLGFIVFMIFKTYFGISVILKIRS